MPEQCRAAVRRSMNIKRTKIVATIGPATSSKEVLTQLILEGVNVARLNFSHGSYEDHQHVIDTVREIDGEMGTFTAILADLQGPKIRIGEVENNGIELIKGKEIKILTQDIVGTTRQVGTNYLSFAKDVQPGELVLLDDGKLQL